MSQRLILSMAKSGRPDLAAINAGMLGRIRLAAYVARFPHESGTMFTVRDLVTRAMHAHRCIRNGKDHWGKPI